MSISTQSTAFTSPQHQKPATIRSVHRDNPSFQRRSRTRISPFATGIVIAAATCDQLRPWVSVPAVLCVYKLYGTLSVVLRSLAARRSIPHPLSDPCTLAPSRNHHSQAHTGQVVLRSLLGLAALEDEELVSRISTVELQQLPLVQRRLVVCRICQFDRLTAVVNP